MCLVSVSKQPGCKASSPPDRGRPIASRGERAEYETSPIGAKHGDLDASCISKINPTVPHSSLVEGLIHNR
ncbi:hypothetical protein VYU27_006638 [Nannochloropsis oceanica]